MVEPMFHKEKIMTIGNILREIRKSVNKKSQMSLRDMLVLAQIQFHFCHLASMNISGFVRRMVTRFSVQLTAVFMEAGDYMNVFFCRW